MLEILANSDFRLEGTIKIMDSSRLADEANIRDLSRWKEQLEKKDADISNIRAIAAHAEQAVSYKEDELSLYLLHGN